MRRPGTARFRLSDATSTCRSECSADTQARAHRLEPSMDADKCPAEFTGEPRLIEPEQDGFVCSSGFAVLKARESEPAGAPRRVCGWGGGSCAGHVTGS